MTKGKSFSLTNKSRTPNMKSKNENKLVDKFRTMRNKVSPLLKNSISKDPFGTLRRSL